MATNDTNVPAAAAALNATSRVYRDFSVEPVNDANAAHPEDKKFPLKLYDALAGLEAAGQSHIARFLPHGRAFVVSQPNKFIETILQVWFHQSKYTSFQRQLNIYGFTRITSGPDKDAYYHERFLRGHRHLIHAMPRLSIKGTGPRRPAVGIEPNLYTLPSLAWTPWVVDQTTWGQPVVALLGGWNRDEASAIHASTVSNPCAVANPSVAMSNPSMTNQFVPSQPGSTLANRQSHHLANLLLSQAVPLSATHNATSNLYDTMPLDAATGNHQPLPWPQGGDSFHLPAPVPWHVTTAPPTHALPTSMIAAETALSWNALDAQSRGPVSAAPPMDPNHNMELYLLALREQALQQLLGQGNR